MGARLLRKDRGPEEHVFFSFLIPMDGGMNIKSSFICYAFRYLAYIINAKL